MFFYKLYKVLRNKYIHFVYTVKSAYKEQAYKDFWLIIYKELILIPQSLSRN